MGAGIETTLDDLSQYALANYGFSINKTHFYNLFLMAPVKGGIIELTATLILLFSPIVFLLSARKRNEGKYALALATGIILIYFSSDVVNIAFGHDIIDHLFVFSTELSIAMARGCEHS